MTLPLTVSPRLKITISQEDAERFEQLRIFARLQDNAMQLRWVPERCRQPRAWTPRWVESLRPWHVWRWNVRGQAPDHSIDWFGWRYRVSFKTLDALEEWIKNQNF